MRGIKGVSISRGGGERLFEVEYYGPVAAYRVNGGPRRWTITPLANRKAGQAMQAAFRKDGTEK